MIINYSNWTIFFLSVNIYEYRYMTLNNNNNSNITLYDYLVWIKNLVGIIYSATFSGDF